MHAAGDQAATVAAGLGSAGASLTHAARFVHTLAPRDLPPSVRDRARQMVLDAFAVMLAGMAEPRVRQLSLALRRRGSLGSSTFADGASGDAADAALVNATASCAQVLDEGHKFARGHVGTYVLPAVLAMAEEREATGAAFATAYVAGYEIAARLGVACRVRPSMHPSGTWGTVGAAAAVARLMGQGEAGIRETMNVAAPLTLATSWQAAVEGATVRDLYSGVGAASAVMAPRYVVAGFRGCDDDVSHVFGQVASDRFDAAALDRGLGRDWEVLRNYFKVHACCRNFQSGIDVALALREKHAIDPARIARVTAETFAIPVRDNAEREPRNVLAARESFPVSLGLALLHGRCDASVYTDERVAAPALRALADRVELRCDPSLEAMFPLARPTRLTIALDDGSVVSGFAAVAYGDPDRPLSNDDLDAKFAACVAGCLTTQAANELRAAIDGLFELCSVAELTAPLRHGLVHSALRADAA
jgi:2-methylcitrate dehydratase PrpD